MPKPKLSKNTRKPRKIVEPIKKPPRIVNEQPEDKSLLIPVEEELGLQEILVDKAYSSILKDIRNDLNQPQRLLSRIIHAKNMDAFHDFLVKTVARPYALLGASFITFIGVFISVFFAKTIGYSYNYLTFLTLFVIGYILELIVEIIINLFRFL